MDNIKGIFRTIFAVLMFFAVISAFFYLPIVGIKSDYSPAMTMEEIAQADFSTTLVPLNKTICDWYPEQLYLPEDFAKEEHIPGNGKAMYGTYRMLLPLPAGRVYGITGLTCSYAQRVYVNGALLSEVGTVSSSPEGFVPRTDSYSVFFTPETDETEIIVQLAHWNNKNGYFNQVYLAEQEPIVAVSRANSLASGLIVGTLFAFAVFFFGMFLFYHDKRHLLWFSLVCFFSGLYFFIFQNKDIMVLIPSLPWALSHKAEYLSQLACYTLLIVYAVSITKLKIGKWQRAVFFTLTGGVMLFYIIAPSTFYSYHKAMPMNTYAFATAGATVYVLYRVIKDKLYRRMDNLIVMLCLIAGIGAYAFDFITDRNYNVMPFGTMLTVFFNAVAIVMQLSRMEQELNLTLLRENEISETNAILARMSRLKSDFLHNIAHEMKTPLTIMSGFAQITDWQVKDGCIDDTTGENLKTIYDEAIRLSNMVERLSKLAFDNELMPRKDKVSVISVLNECAAVCAPILQKNDNTLSKKCEGDLYVHANADSLLQVLINLTINANKHTDNGSIELTVKPIDDFAVFTIEDNGSGITPEILLNMFDKGVSGDNSSGLGLAISKEIIEDNNGIIRVEHTGKNGTCMSFTVPLWNMDCKEEHV